MYCRNCGKEINNNSNFCSYCGSSQETTPIDLNQGGQQNYNNNNIGIINRVLHAANLKLLSYIITVIIAVIQIIIRFSNNEVITIIYGLAYEDYYILSTNGKIWMALIALIHLATAIFLNIYGQKIGRKMGAGPIVSAVIVFVISFLMLVVRIPAPY